MIVKFNYYCLECDFASQSEKYRFDDLFSESQLVPPIAIIQRFTVF